MDKNSKVFLISMLISLVFKSPLPSGSEGPYGTLPHQPVETTISLWSSIRMFLYYKCVLLRCWAVASVGKTGKRTPEWPKKGWAGAWSSHPDPSDVFARKWGESRDTCIRDWKQEFGGLFHWSRAWKQSHLSAKAGTRLEAHGSIAHRLQRWQAWC